MKWTELQLMEKTLNKAFQGLIDEEHRGRWRGKQVHKEFK